jgi:hypothetical protein
MHILENVQPDLAKRLRKLEPARACRLLIECCHFVGSHVFTDPELELFVRYRSERALDQGQQQSLISYAEAAEDRYLDLKDGGAEEREWLPWFQRARLATALAKTAGAPGWEDTADGFYELTVIFEDSSVVEFIKRNLPEVQA